MATLRLNANRHTRNRKRIPKTSTLFSSRVDPEGELGVFPNHHVPLLTTLKPGELRVRKDGRETALAVGEGFVEITGDAVSVLTDMALESAQIDEAAAEKAVASAKGGDERRSRQGRSRGRYGLAAKSAGPVARQTAPATGLSDQGLWRLLWRAPV